MKKFELSIPKPCHENWDAMSPEDKGRFCGACQKTVVDFTDMSDRQVAEFFKRPAASVCGRFGGDQLNRVIEVPRKRLPWIKYFFTIALPAFLLSKKAAAQGLVIKKDKTEVCNKPTTKVDTTNKQKALVRGDVRIVMGRISPRLLLKNTEDSLQTITGKVVDGNGKPIVGATLIFKDTKIGTTTKSEGEFSIRQINSKQTELLVSCLGYEAQFVNFRNQKSTYITLSPAIEMGEVVIVGAVVRKKPEKIPLITASKKDSTLSRFSIFPNPVEHNSFVTIETKDLEDGRYNLAIITSTGEIVQTKELVIENKLKRITVQLENIAAAPYFIRLTNKANNKAYTEILLVK